MVASGQQSDPDPGHALAAPPPVQELVRLRKWLHPDRRPPRARADAAAAPVDAHAGNVAAKPAQPSGLQLRLALPSRTPYTHQTALAHTEIDSSWLLQETRSESKSEPNKKCEN